MTRQFFNIGVFILGCAALILGWGTMVSAKETAAQLMITDPLQRTLDIARESTQPLADPQKKDQATLDQMLKTLKNPFLPKLPKVETPANRSERKTVTQRSSPPPQPGPTAKAVVRPDLRLSGLIWNTTRPQAIVNNKVVQEGDRIDDWTIIAITKAGVEVTSQNTIFLIEP